MNGIKVNWLPVTFSDTFLPLFMKKVEGKVPGHRIYRNIKLSSSDLVTGSFAFEDKSEFPEYEKFNVSLQHKANADLIKQFIQTALEKEFEVSNYETYRRKQLLHVIDKNSKIDILPAFSILNEYVIYPHFILDARDNNLVYGIVIDSKYHYQFNIDKSDLSLFRHRKVEFLLDGFKKAGDLLSVDSDNAQIAYREKIEKFKYQTKTVTVAKDQVIPVGSIANFRLYCSNKHRAQKDALLKKLRTASKSLTEAGKVNQNILHEKYDKIKSFTALLIGGKNKFSVHAAGGTTFRIESDFVYVGEADQLGLPGGRLPKRQFVFTDKSVSGNYGQFQGIKTFGPLRKIDDAKNIKFLFVFPLSRKDQANALFFALRNGLGPFPGIESFFGVPFGKENVFAVQVNDAPSMETLANNYGVALTQYLDANKQTLTPEKTLAFLIVPTNDPDDHPNPYHKAKSILFKYGIASQAIEYETIQSNYGFKWSISNIALGAFAKLGGIPWRLRHQDGAKQLIFGIGQKQLFDKSTNSLKRIVGYTVCVTADGQFRSVSTFKPAVSRDEFLANFKEQLKSAITHALKSSQSVDELIIHFPKRSSYEEVEKVEETLDEMSASSNALLPYAILRIADAAPFCLFDLEHDSCLPPEGTMARIANNDAIVCIPGRQDMKSIFATPKYPLRVTLGKSTLTKTKFDELLYQVYSLAGANWRGFNARELPITIFYSELIAELIAKLDLYDVDFYDGLRSLEKIPWFL